MKNLITLAAALMIGAGMSAFAQGDAPAPGGDSKPAAPSAPAKAKKAGKHSKKKSKDEAPKAQ